MNQRHQQTTYFLVRTSLLLFKSYSLGTTSTRKAQAQPERIPTALGATDHLCLRLECSFSTESRNWHMQTPTQKDMSKKEWKEKWWSRCSVTCSNCQITKTPSTWEGQAASGPRFPVSASQGSVTGWRLWQQAEWPGEKSSEGYQLTGLGGWTLRADLSLPYS